MTQLEAARLSETLETLGPTDAQIDGQSSNGGQGKLANQEPLVQNGVHAEPSASSVGSSVLPRQSLTVTAGQATGKPACDASPHHPSRLTSAEIGLQPLESACSSLSCGLQPKQNLEPNPITSPSQGLPPGKVTRKSGPNPPPSLFKVLTTSLKDIVDTVQGLYSRSSYFFRKIRQKEPFNIQLHHIVLGLLWIFVIVNMFLVKLLHPKPWWLAFFVSQGTLLGLLASFVYYHNKKRKAEIRSVLGSNLGLKGLNFLLGGLPSWLSYTEREKAQWLNRTLEEVWPFYDRGVSKMIKKMVEDNFKETLKTMKVPGVKSIGFKHLTFGDAPFRVESIYVTDRHGNDEAVVMELDLRWCGDANIALAIEFAMGDLPRMCPSVNDIKFAGSLRVVLQPLLNDIPGFGAAIITFRRPPQLSYSLCFGRIPGGATIAKLITPAIDNVINGQIVNMLVWPQRLLIPIINTPEMQYELEKLTFRTQGLMKVRVIEAKDLPTADVVGSSDPFVELSTDGKHVVSTKVIPDSLNPKWDETHYLLIHEPTREHMKVSVYDHDAFSPIGIVKLNFKEVLASKEFLGRALINVLPITSREGTEYERWYDLGKGEWDKVGGCGSGRGQLLLACKFHSFTSMKPVDWDPVHKAKKGILIFKLLHAHNLPRAIGAGMKMTVLAQLECGKDSDKTSAVTSDADHHWNNLNSVHFHGIMPNADLTVKMYDRTTGEDEYVGGFNISVPDIIASADYNPLSDKHEAHFMARTFKLNKARSGWIVARVRFVPYFD